MIEKLGTRLVGQHRFTRVHCQPCLAGIPPVDPAELTPSPFEDAPDHGREPRRFHHPSRLAGCRVHNGQREAVGLKPFEGKRQPGRVRSDHGRGNTIPEPPPRDRRTLRVHVEHDRPPARPFVRRREGKRQGRFPGPAFLSRYSATVVSL